MSTVMTGLTNLGGIVGASTAFGGLPLQFGGDLLGLAILFFILAIVAAVVGARGVAGITMEIARILIVVFLILAVISLLL